MSYKPCFRQTSWSVSPWACRAQRIPDESKDKTQVPTILRQRRKESNQHVIVDELPSERHSSVAPGAVQMPSASMSVSTRTGFPKKLGRKTWPASRHDPIHIFHLSGTNRLIRVLTERSMFTKLYRPELSRINRTALG